MNKIIVYTKDNCPYCDRAKMLLDLKQLDYTQMKLGKDLTREEFMNLFPNVKTMPFIIIDDEHIGGYNELRARLA